MSSGLDFSQPLLELYKTVTTRIKKKSFFRKINYVESIEQYSELMKVLRRATEEEYSGTLSIAVAKCHKQQHNILLEAFFYHRAGRLFLNFQKQVTDTKYPSLYESAEVGIECYREAISIYLTEKKFAMSSSLYSELADYLLLMGRSHEAANFFVQAAQLQQSDNTMSAIVSLKKAFQCEFSKAIEMLQWISKLATEESTLNNDTFYLDIRIEANISYIFLHILQGEFKEARLLIEVAMKEQTEPSLRLLNDFSNPYPLNIYFSTEWFFALLSCLVDAVEGCIEREVIRIQSELKELLSTMQNELLYPILDVSRVNLV